MGDVRARRPRSLGDAELLMRNDPGRWPLTFAGAAVLVIAVVVIVARADFLVAALTAVNGAMILAHHQMRTGWYLSGYADGWAAKDDANRNR